MAVGAHVFITYFRTEQPSASRPHSLRLRSYRYLPDAKRIGEIVRAELSLRAVYIIGRKSKDDGLWFELHTEGFRTTQEVHVVAERAEASGIRFASPAIFDEYAGNILRDLTPFESADVQADGFRVEPSLRTALERMPNSTRYSLKFLTTLQPAKPFKLPEGMHRITEKEEQDLDARLLQPVSTLVQSSAGVGVLAQYQDQLDGKKTSVMLYLWSEHEQQLASAAYAALPAALCSAAFCERKLSVFNLRSRDYEALEISQPSGSTFVLSSMQAGETWIIEGPPSIDAAFRGLFEQQMGAQGLFAYLELVRAVGALPAKFNPEGEELSGLTIVQIGAEYISAKKNQPWAQLMRGHWAYSFRFLDRGASWTIDLFDFRDDDIALRAHNNKYDDVLRRVHASWENRLSKAYGFDGVYSTRVGDEKAWYIDFFRIARSKELNFVRDGKIFALSSFVLPKAPLLRMDDLKERALSLPAFQLRRPTQAIEHGPLFLE